VSPRFEKAKQERTARPSLSPRSTARTKTVGGEVAAPKRPTVSLGCASRPWAVRACQGSAFHVPTLIAMSRGEFAKFAAERNDGAQPRFRADDGWHVRDRSRFRAGCAFGARKT